MSTHQNQIFCYNARIANLFGLHAAIVYQHIIYWIGINAKKKDVELIDGKVWMYETQKEIADFFGHMTEKEVRDGIKKLVDNGLLISKNLSKNKFNRTNSYALPNFDEIDQKNDPSEEDSKNVCETTNSSHREDETVASNGRTGLIHRTNSSPLYIHKNTQKNTQDNNPLPPKGEVPIGTGGEEKISFHDNVFLTSLEHETLQKELGKELLNDCLSELADWKKANPLQAKKHKDDHRRIRKWVITAVKERKIREKRVQDAETRLKNPEKSFKQNRQDLNYEQVAKNFKHGGIYNGAECYLNQESIAFGRGMKHQQLRFTEFGFNEQFSNMLRNFGITLTK